MRLQQLLTEARAIREALALGWLALAVGVASAAPPSEALVARLADRDVHREGLWGFSCASVPGKPRYGDARTEDGRLVLTSGERDPRIGVAWLVIPTPGDLPVADYRYLTVRMKGNGVGWYYVRPEGRTAAGKPCNLWHETAATDDRQGEAWETATFSLTKLAEECETGAVSVTGIGVACASMVDEPSILEVAFVCLHGGLVPPTPVAQESDFSNSLDDDGDGQTDADDDALRPAAAPKWVLAYYHPWFGTPSGPHRRWAGWRQKPILMADVSTPSKPNPDASIIDPEDLVPDTLGRRDIAAPYYPLDFAAFPDYVPHEPLDYARYGGVERYDCRDVDFVADQVRCAKRFGIDGFIMDVGGIGVFSKQVEAALEAARKVGGFHIAIVYDWYYWNPSYGLNAPKPPEDMARDLFYWRSRFGSHPSYLQHGGRPVVFASFMSGSGVSLGHWQKAVALSSSVDALPVDGRLESVAGRTIEVTLRFARHIKLPPGEGRPLLMAFGSVRYLDATYRELDVLDIGSPQARPSLLQGWSFDEGPEGATWCWASAENREARLRLAVPEGTAFISIGGPGHTADPNEYTIAVDGRECGTGRKGPTTAAHSTVLATTSRAASRAPSHGDRDYLLLLDARHLARAFDGYATYGESASAMGCEVSSGYALSAATAFPGYDDTVIRSPGNVVDREGGKRFRQSFERALEAEPGFLQICTWSEWGEGTVIEPTVEFGYEYCEIALTYSLIYRGLLRVKDAPSAAGLTVRRYDPEGTDGIRITCEQAVSSAFPALAGEFWVTAPDGVRREVVADAEGLRLTLAPGQTVLRRR